MSAADVEHLLRAGHDPRPVHFMGVGGAGMSALAELLRGRGVPITGCDTSADAAAELARVGVRFDAGHDPAHVEGARAVVVTAAVPRDHPELEAARSLGVPVIRRADALGLSVAGARTVVAVAGTHGKTTTTVLTTDALAAAGADPTGLAGGRVAAWGGHLRRGADEVIVVEADEYDRSFLSITPGVAIITNVEADHLDIYSDITEIRQAFEQFIRPARIIVSCADDTHAAGLAVPSSAEIVRYGFTSRDARLVATDFRVESNGAAFTVVYDGKAAGDILLGVPGRHNALNALAAIGCGFALGYDLDQMRAGIEAFTGVERRFQRVATVRGVSIVDDYAHHPTEVAATLDAARETANGARIVVAFQPHLYSRTRDFAEEFAAALSAADAVFLADVYPAREQPIPGVTSALVGDALRRLGRPPVWTGAREEVAPALKRFARDGDLVLTLGAGDITRSAYELRDLLRLGAAAD